ncbi:MAG: hypothetical protein AAF560_13895 [Acidobacteriota bacterium]
MARKQQGLTLIGLGIAVSALLLTVIFDLDLFERSVGLLEALERYEVDELVIPLLIFLVFALLDQIKNRRSHAVELEKVKIYRAMLTSTHHILNNFLNQMRLFQLTAKDTPGFDPEVLAFYERIVEDASTQIEALGSITEIDEVSIKRSVIP